MSNRELRTLIDGYAFFEGPRYHENLIWVSDFYTQQIIAVNPNSGHIETVIGLDDRPSGSGRLPDGRLVVGSMLQRKLLRQEGTGQVVTHADLSSLLRGSLNDLVLDVDGNAYVGDFGFDLMAGEDLQPTALYRVTPDGSVSVAADNLVFPNGTVITDDGNTLIVAETFAYRLSAFDITKDGTLDNRREWARFGPAPATRDMAHIVEQAPLAPDGICLDAEGAIWVADAVGNRVVRVAEGGRIIEQISTGDIGTFACMLGGTTGTTLFLCCAPSFHEDKRKGTREAKLLSTEVDVPHAGLP